MNPSCNPLEVTAAISPLTLEDTSQLFFHMCAGLNTSHDIAAQCLNTSHNIAPQCLNTSHDFAAQCVDPKQHYVNVWLNIDPGASWEKLATGLRKIDKNSLATEIESQKCQYKEPRSACERGDMKAVTSPFTAGADFDDRDKDGRSALKGALGGMAVAPLLGRRAKTDSQNKDRNSAPTMPLGSMAETAPLLEAGATTAKTYLQNKQSSNNVVVVSQPSDQVTPNDNLVWVLCLMVVCFCTCNPVAFLCLIPALILSCLSGNAEDYKTAASYGKASCCCSLCSVGFFVIGIVVAIIFVILLFTVGLGFIGIARVNT